MLKQSLLALAIAAVAATSSLTMPTAAEAKSRIVISIGGLGHHHHHHRLHKRIVLIGDLTPSCHWYKRKFRQTGKLHWLRKYERCLDLYY